MAPHSASRTSRDLLATLKRTNMLRIYLLNWTRCLMPNWHAARVTKLTDSGHFYLIALA
jgi:hypothetical protein